MYGFTGKILHVDLTNKTLNIEEPSEEFYRFYWGGSLMGLYYLWKNSPAGIDAFDPANTLSFFVSAPTGLPLSGQSRCTATCKSPSTGGVADSQAGGFWPAELKFAGYDGIVITGASDTPVYLKVIEGEAELVDASHIWGKHTADVDEILKEELGDKKIEIAQIGRAGEKKANFAAVMNMANRAWGRTGIGAVMGSKMLKAIVVRGTRKVQPADKKRVMALAKWGAKNSKAKGADSFGRYGTAGVTLSQHKAGGLPTRNFDTGVMDTFEEAEAIDGERLYDEFLKGAAEGKQDRQGRDTCHACIVRCKRVVESEYKDIKLIPEYGGPEYESIATFGSYCDISDMEAVIYANQLCNQYGVDTISCGATIAWAMECFEKGVITTEDTGGIELRYGDADAMIKMLEMTLEREGFGDILADGSAKAADRLGKGHEYLITVKGQELPAHMPQVKRSLGTIYATLPFGADHQSSEHDSMLGEYFDYYKDYFAEAGITQSHPDQASNPEKMKDIVHLQYLYSNTDTMSVCQFVYSPSWTLYGPEAMRELMSAATGWDIPMDEMFEVGKRRLNLMRAYNAREGLNRDNDTLPKKLFKVRMKGGVSDGILLDEAEFQQSLVDYYDSAGWDQETGNPTKETLESIGLDWVAAELA